MELARSVVARVNDEEDGGVFALLLQMRRREDVCAAESWWSRTKMVVRELAEKIT